MSDTIEAAVTREPLTYERHAHASYFRDLALSERDGSAAERLERHAEEMRTVVPEREAAIEQRARAAGLEYRVNPNRTDGQGGYFSVPLWLIDEFAGAPRPARVLAALMPNLPLPRGVGEVKLPRLTAGTAAGVANDGQAVPAQDIVDAAASQPVTAVAGMADVALQLLEQSPPGAHLDHAIFQDLTGSYDAKVEALLINGAGTGTEFAGVLNLTAGAGGVSSVDYADGSPTYAEILVPATKAFAQLGDARNLPPEVWLMRSARWAWLTVGDVSLAALADPAWMGRRVALDDAIPTTVGGAGQDALIAIRPSDGILLESAQRTEVFFEVLSGTLHARLRLHGNASAVHRYPTGIAKVTGTGMAVQSGY